MYDFTFRLNLLFLNKDKKKMQILSREKGGDCTKKGGCKNPPSLSTGIDTV